jgi:hypothetical protein
MSQKYNGVPKKFYKFPFQPVAKFGKVVLWMIASPPTAQNCEKSPDLNSFFFFLTTTVMNPKNHHDNSQGSVSVPVSDNRSTLLQNLLIY